MAAQFKTASGADPRSIVPADASTSSSVGIAASAPHSTQHGTLLAQRDVASVAPSARKMREEVPRDVVAAREQLQALLSALDLCADPGTLDFNTLSCAMQALRAREELLQCPQSSLDSLTLNLHLQLHAALARALAAAVKCSGNLGLEQRSVGDIQAIVDGLGTAVKCAGRMRANETRMRAVVHDLGLLTRALLRHLNTADLKSCSPGPLLSLLNWQSRCWHSGIVALDHAEAGALFRILMQRICTWSPSSITTKQMAKCFVQIRSITSLELVSAGSGAGKEVTLALKHLCAPGFLRKLSGMYGRDYVGNPVLIVPVCIDNVASSLARAVEGDFLGARSPSALLALEHLVTAIKNFVSQHGAGKYNKLPALLDLLHVMLATDPATAPDKAMREAHRLIEDLLDAHGYAPRVAEWKREDMRKLLECRVLHARALASPDKRQAMSICVGVHSEPAPPPASAVTAGGTRYKAPPAAPHQLAKGQRKHGSSKERSAQLEPWIDQLNSLPLADAKQLVRKFGFPALFEQPRARHSALTELVLKGERNRKLLAWIAQESGFHSYARHNSRIVTRVLEEIRDAAGEQWPLLPELFESMYCDFDGSQKAHQLLGMMLEAIRTSRDPLTGEAAAGQDPELEELRRATEHADNNDALLQDRLGDDIDGVPDQGNFSSALRPLTPAFHQPCLPGDEGAWLERLMQLDLRNPHELREFFWRVRRAPERLDADMRALTIEINARVYFPVESLRDDQNARASFIVLRRWINRAVSERVHARYFTPRYLADRLAETEDMERQPSRLVHNLAAREAQQSRRLLQERTLAAISGVIFALLYQLSSAASKARAADRWQLRVPGGPARISWLDSASATLQQLADHGKALELQPLLDTMRQLFAADREMLNAGDVRRINDRFAQDSTFLLLSLLVLAAAVFCWLRQYRKGN